MTEYINKEYYKSIPLSERTYLDPGANLNLFMDRLNTEKIPFSATISDYKRVVTVSKANAARAKDILASMPKKENAYRIIGNSRYSDIPDKRYVNMDAQTAIQTASILSKDGKIRFSGRVTGNKATITVSGDNNAAVIRSIIDELNSADLFEEMKKSGFERIQQGNGNINIRNMKTGAVCSFTTISALRESWNGGASDFFHPSAFRIAATEDHLFDPYYISEYDLESGLETDVYYDRNGDCPTFATVSEALEYVAQNNVEVTNPQEEIEEFRRKDSEREGAVISFENSLIIEKLPQENGIYPDDIRYNAETGEYKWLFFNPDGDEGKGEFCELTFGDEDIYEAYHRRLDETDPEKSRTAFIDHIFEVSRQYIVNTYSAQFEGYANDYMNKPDSVERYYTNIGNTGDRDKFISSLESRSRLIAKEKEEKADAEKQTETAQDISAIIEKVVNDYTDYENAIRSEGIDAVIQAASELTEKKKIRQYFEESFETDDYSEHELYILENATQLMNDVFDVWLGYSNRSSAADIRYAVKDALEAGRVHYGVKQEIPVEELPSFVDQVLEKLEKEYYEYKQGLLSLQPQEIIDRITEVNAKKEIFEYSQDIGLDLSDEQLAALLTSKNLLDEVYQEWLSLDTNGLEDIGIAFEECADAIIESLNRNSPQQETSISLDFSDTEITRYNNSTDNYTLYPTGKILEELARRAEPKKFGYANAREMLDDDDFHYEVYAVVSDDRKFAGIHFNAMDKDLDVAVGLRPYEEDNLLDSIQSYELSVMPAIDRAKYYITEYMRKEFDDEPDFSNLSAISVAYTTHEVTDREIQTYVDLENSRIYKTYNGSIVDELKYESLEKMMSVLENLEFDDLVSISTNDLIDYYADKFEDFGNKDRYVIDRENEIITMSYFNPDSSVGGEIISNSFDFDTLKGALDSNDPYEYVSGLSKQSHTTVETDAFFTEAEKFFDDNDAVYGSGSEGIRELGKAVFPDLVEEKTEQESVDMQPPIFVEDIKALSPEESKVYFDSVDSIRSIGEAIHKAVNDNNPELYHYDIDKALEDVLKRYSADKVAFVLAKYIDNYRHDGRISRANVEWADSMLSDLPETARNMRYVIGDMEQVHAIINNDLVTTFRNDYFKDRKIGFSNGKEKAETTEEINDYKEIDVETAISMWMNGFTVFVDGEKVPPHPDDYNEEYPIWDRIRKGNAFRAFPADLEKEVMIESICELIDTICEASGDYEGIKYYANDEEHPFKWNDGQNVYQNVEKALVANNTYYIEEFLNDAVYSEDVQAALDKLNEYRKNLPDEKGTPVIDTLDDKQDSDTLSENNEEHEELTLADTQYFYEKWDDIQKEADMLMSHSALEADVSEEEGSVVEKLPETRFTSLDNEKRTRFELHVYIPSPEDSPWGEIQTKYQIANGVFDVSTASHGGIMIKNDIAALILSPEARAIGFRENGYTCYEEDCDSAVAYRELIDKGIYSDIEDFFRTNYSGSAREKYPSFSNSVNDTIKRIYPEYWEKREEAISQGKPVIKGQALFSVSQNGEQRFFKTDKSVDEIISDIESGKTFSELSEMNSSGRISESEYAEIQQSAEFTYSVEVDLDYETAKIYTVNNGKGGIPEGERSNENISIKTVNLDIDSDVKREIGTSAMPDSPFGVKSEFTTHNSPDQAMIDHILQCGSSELESLERIVYQFSLGRPTVENAEFLKKEFAGRDAIGNGRGYIFDEYSEQRISAWFRSEGISIGMSETAFPTGSRAHISWEEAAERITKLLDEGRYCSQEIIDNVPEYYRDKTAGDLWELHRNLSEGVEYFIPESYFRGGYPESKARISEVLKNREFLMNAEKGLTELSERCKENKDILRSRLYTPDEVLERIKGLFGEHKVFKAQKDFSIDMRFFITEDEKDRLLVTRGSGVESGKFRISDFFSENHTEKEKIEFLKKEYGIGGMSWTGFDENHDAKGISLKKTGCEVFMKWNEVAKRITRLVSEGKYILPEDIAERECRIAWDEDHGIDEEPVKSVFRPTFEIYQVKQGSEYRDYRWASTDQLDKFGQKISRDNYDKVYTGDLSMIGSPDKLDGIFEKFNIDLPDDFNGHSASVSDIIVLNLESGSTAHYIDSKGFKVISDIFFGKEKKVTKKQPEDKGPITINKVGDFYELYDKDAENAADDLGLTLTKKGIRQMCGFPADKKDEYTKKLRDAGYSVLVGVVFELAAPATEKVVEKNPGIITAESNNITLDGFSGTWSVVNSMTYGGRKLFLLENDRLGDLSVYPVMDSEKNVLSDETHSFDDFTSTFTESEVALGLYGEKSISFAVVTFDDEKTVITDSAPDEDSIYDMDEYIDYIASTGKDRVDVSFVYYSIGEGESDSPDEDQKEYILKNLDDVISEADVLESGSFRAYEPEEEYDHDYNDDDDEIDEQEVDIEEAEPQEKAENHISADKIAVGDRFLYKGKEYTVTSMQGIYPDEVAVLYMQKDSLHMTEYEVTSNFDKHILAEQEYLGNALKNERDAGKRSTDYEPKMGDIIELDRENLYSIENIESDMLTLREMDTLIPDTLKIPLSELYTKDFEVIEENEYYKYRSDYLPGAETPEVQITEGKPAEIKPSEQKSPVKTELYDYVITDENFGVSGGAKSRYADNINAIKTLKIIESENRNATPEEQEILVKYTGWGAIPQAFDASNEKWSREYEELKSVLTEDEYAAARKSTMNAHYTSPTVINAIYAGLEKLGFAGGRILEPAAGIGNFFGRLPESMSGSKLTGVELDSITGRIAQQLYQNADIQIKGFEETNFPDNSFDVAVGNVPFGEYKVHDRRYDDDNFLIHDYFFGATRS